MSNHAASRKHYYTVLLDRTLVCFLLVVVLNFFLPRLLPGNPVAYLTGFSEQDMTPAQVWVQKGFACRSLFHNSADHPQRRANVFNWAGSYDRMLFSKPAAALYRAQLPGGCARHGRVCYGTGFCICCCRS